MCEPGSATFMFMFVIGAPIFIKIEIEITENALNDERVPSNIVAIDTEWNLEAHSLIHSLYYQHRSMNSR
jgi:hypothetical protein